jgi:uncharacterized protein YlxW (UPF0749 family)
MKIFWSWSAKILLVLLLISVWYIYEQKKEYETLTLSHQQLTLDLENAKKSLADLHQENQALEKKSVEGLLRETNKVVVSGWETLLNAVEGELNKAREMIQQKQAPAQAPADNAEDNTAILDEQESPSSESPVIINGERT